MVNSRPGPSRRTLIAAGVLVLWVTALVFGWALRPISDTVPVVVNPTSELAVELAENPSATPEDAPRAQLVMCNSPVDGSPRDVSEPLPELRSDYVYDRKPCDGPHTGARLAGVVNVLAMLALIGGWIWISRRTRTEAVEQLTVPEAVTR
ncbi:MAG: hypothetical protein GKR86_13700 [Ilumatobacter sp.]|nr:hypothetical protein [Ilumatobacter sp.]NKB42062.1 hypothetical protein [Ilumatobacter sp.]